MNMSVTALFASVLALAVGGPAADVWAEGHHEAVATSCEDCPNYSGAFSVTNETGSPIKYQVRWGDRNAWHPIQLQTGHIETHRYPLGENPQARIPTPFVRFDDTANDGRTTFHEVRMEFYAVGYAGYGPTVNRTEPKRYRFTYAADRRHLSLIAD